MLQQVVKLINNHRLAEARTLCERLNHSNKKNLEIWLLLAEIYQRLGMPEKAENSCQKAIKLKADYAPAHAQLAMLYHGQGKFVKAESCYRRSLKLNKKQAFVYFNLGAVLQELNKLNDAQTQYKQAIKLKPDYAKAYANLGFILRHQKNFQESIDCYRKALQLAPDIAEIHYNLALSLMETGQAETAEQHQRQALSLKPDYADALAGLGSVQFFNGDLEKSVNSYQLALKHQPFNVEILCAYANTLSALGQHEKAMTTVKQALNIEPENAKAHILKGFIYQSLGKLNNALECCEQVLKLNSQDKKAIILAASIYEKKGDAKQALHYLKPLLEEKYPQVGAILTFSSISKSLSLVNDAIERIERILQNSSEISTPDKIKLHFALGEAYDNQKNYDRAFKNFHFANELKQAVFDPEILQKNTDAQINTFFPHFNKHLKSASIRSNRPVFIVGMPRSGTSLVEQILASHPQISAAGELPNINNLALSMHQTNESNNHYPDCLKQIDSHQLDDTVQTYLDCLSKVNADTHYVTDKMPGNYMHLGLIQLMFPDARIIHCIRNPLDTALSCYFQNFSHSHPWIYDLQNCGKVYLEYQRLMQHWKNVLSIPILDIHYEELVSNQEATSRQMIEFCELDWDKKCLQFHKNKRFIWTASYDQVRQPMYNKSIARWKNYESHIEPLIEILKN